MEGKNRAKKIGGGPDSELPVKVVSSRNVADSWLESFVCLCCGLGSTPLQIPHSQVTINRLT